MNKLPRITQIAIFAACVFSLGFGHSAYASCTMRNCSGNDCKAAQADYRACLEADQRARDAQRSRTDPNLSRSSKAGQNSSNVDRNAKTNPK